MRLQSRSRGNEQEKSAQEKSARSRRRKLEGTPELTAQPKSLPEELNEFTRLSEEGLSADADALGTRYLEDAIEQGDESSAGAESLDLSVTGAPDSDQAFSGPNFEANQDIWENTVNMALQDGGTEDALDELAPAPSAVEIEMADYDEEADAYLHEPEAELDLTQSVLREGSLFDHEVGETGEVESPRLETDDTHRHRHLRAPSARRRPSRSP